MKKNFEVFFLKEVDEFLSNLDKKTKLKIINNIEKSQSTLDVRLFKKLNEEIWEFRTRYRNQHYRLLAFWDKTTQSLVVVTHVIVKKTSQVPQKELNKAEMLMNQYYKTKNES
jgi:phage-related protein